MCVDDGKRGYFYGISFLQLDDRRMNEPAVKAGTEAKLVCITATRLLLHFEHIRTVELNRNVEPVVLCKQC